MFIQIVAGGMDRQPVHELDRCGNDAAFRYDARYRRDRGIHILKEHQKRCGRFGQRRQLDGRFRYDPKRSFRANDQTLQIIPCGVFDDLASQFHDVSRWCY
jgi:hypothetical protein